MLSDNFDEAQHFQVARDVDDILFTLMLETLHIEAFHEVTFIYFLRRRCSLL